MRSRFLALRVRPANRNIPPAYGREPAGVGCWPSGHPASPSPTDYWLFALPESIPLRDLVRLAKIRWRIEHDYRELKDGPAWITSKAVPGSAGTPRHPRRGAQAICTQLRGIPKVPCAGLTLYAVLRELQALLVVWTGVCHTCRQPVQTQTSTQNHQLSST
jgi:hypothetical protein